jgi:hypothetical protein
MTSRRDNRIKPMRFANLNIFAALSAAALLNAAAETLPFAARGFEASKRAGIALTPIGAETWDFSGVGEVRIAVSNASDRAARVRVAVFGEGMSLDAKPKAPCRMSRVPPHAVRTIAVPLNDTPYATDAPVALTGMQGKVPALDDLPDFSKTGRIEVFADATERVIPVVLGVETAFAARKPKIIPADGFFPFVDCYGQFRHDDWPGKIHSDAELAESRRAEAAWLDAHADGPIPGADHFGGWAGGPQLEATGFFRTEKVECKWWFVDPDGHLFWSLGVCSVYPGLPTRVRGREAYFEGRADDSDAWPLRENLVRKYGEDLRAPYAGMAHRRFRAWGINTIGNWHHDYVWQMRRTPYCACIDFSSRTILPSWDGSKAHGRAVPDVFSPKFAEDIAAEAEKWAAKIKDDPWCLGVFVDNELGWDGCGTNVAEVAETYYSTVRAALRKSLPNHLYLGSRIHNDFGEIDAVWRAAARHCDVVSNNLYDREPSYDLPPGASDKPILIGEFHFGAKGRGNLNGGLVAAFDEQERGRLFRQYAGKCLDNPRYVGCHWFQYQDQPLTGRFDGENFACGFVSICDVPYPELVEACQGTAAQMYPRHLGKGEGEIIKF